MPSSNALDPQSPQARAIYELAIHSTIIFALIFVIVTGAIIYAILRFRARPDRPDPRQTGNRKKIPEMPATKSLIGDRSKPMADVDRITLNGKVPKHRYRHAKSIQAENYS